jgi:hypothetical protein
MHDGSEIRNTKRMKRKKDETEKDENKIDETRGIVGDDVKERRFIFMWFKHTAVLSTADRRASLLRRLPPRTSRH